MQSIIRGKGLRGFLAALLTAALIVTSLFAALWQADDAQAYAAKDQTPVPIDFVARFYDGIAANVEGDTDNHVFDSVTLERLARILRTQPDDKKTVIVLGSALNETTQKTLAKINQAAQAYGIKKIYLFDPHIAYDPNDPTLTPIDIFDTGRLYGDAYKAILTTYSSTNGAGLKYIDSAYTSDDTYLFVYDKQGGTAAAVDSAATIAADLLITPADLPDVESNTFDVVADATSVFSAAGLTSGANDDEISQLNQFDYFRSWTSGQQLVTDAHKTGFRLNEITYPELLDLFTIPGEHNIINVGSWCGDSKAAVGLIAENAQKSDSSTVYAFDFRLDGGLATSVNVQAGNGESGNWARSSSNLSITSANGAPGTTTGVNAYKNDAWGTRYIGAHLIEKLTPYDTGYANYTVWYHPNGVASNPSNLKDGTLESVQAKFRSPFLIKWNKDKSPKVTQNWIHRLADYELPWHANQVTAGASAGDLVDPELSSGYLTNWQKEQLRADIGEFFFGTKAYSSAPRTASQISIPKNKGGADSGCGDDNDPMDNQNQTTLLPYSGTDEYDVSKYEIGITYDPTETGAEFAGDTNIHAKAGSKALKKIVFDLRALDIASVSVYNKTSETTLGAVTYTQENDYDRDENKLVIDLGGASIPAGDSFRVNVRYATGYIDDFVSAGQATQGFSKTRNGTGGAAVGEPFGSTYWFPANNTPSDGAAYKISLTYPSTGGYVGVSNGRNTSTNTASGQTTKVWELTSQTAPYQVFAYFSSDAKELAQTVTLSSGTTIAALSYVNNTIYTRNDNRNRDKIGNFYNKLPLYIQTIEQIAGPYPGESIGFIFEDLSDGNGGSAAWGAVETKDRPFYTSANITSENTFVHEFVHQWYGDAVRIADWKSLWLNEGFATYVTDLYYELTQGFDTAAKWKAVYDKENANSLLWEEATADILLETDLFGDAKVAYNKGALALAALRVSVGDTDFFNILKGWPVAYKDKAVTTADFIEYASKTANVNLDAWADEWLYETGKPESFPTKPIPENGSVVDPSDITVTLDGGSSVTLPTIKVGEPIGTLPTPTKDGYTFDGWYVDGKKIDASWIVPSTPFTLVARWTKGTQQSTSAAISLKTAKVKAIANKAYTGKALKPAVTVTLGAKTLKAGTDYTASYKSNTLIGKATVTVTGKGAYKDSVAATFKIVPAKAKFKSAKAGKKKVTLKWTPVKGGVTKQQISYKLKTSKKWKTVTLKASAKSKAIKKLKKGKRYQFRIRSYKTVSGVKYYSAWSAVKTVKVK